MEKITELKAGDIIRHYKINSDGSGIHRYVVLLTKVLDTEDMIEKVVYKALHPPYMVFCRPETMFTDVVDVDVNGEPIFRFLKETEPLSITLEHIHSVTDFFKAVGKCLGDVKLVSAQGDCLNLKSELSKKLMAANVFNHGEVVNSLQLVLSDPTDVQYFVGLLGD